MGDTIPWEGISVFPNGRKISFWVLRDPMSYECECHILDLESRRIDGTIRGNVTASRIDWDRNGNGTFAQQRLDGQHSATWQVVLVGSSGYVVKSFDLNRSVSSVHWLADERLA